jgi:hypothetical protein
MPLLPPAAFFSLLFCLAACSNPAPTTHADTTNTTARSDTPAKTATVAAKPVDTASYQDPEPSTREIMAEYLKSCADTVKIDTTVTLLGKRLTIHLRHYSNGDSAIVIPQRYASIYGLKQFKTSDFETRLIINEADRTLFDTMIRKNIFRDSVDESVAAYGTLYFDRGGIHYFRDHLNLYYSYSIPLTDVGRGVSLDFP